MHGLPPCRPLRALSRRGRAVQETRRRAREIMELKQRKAANSHLKEEASSWMASELHLQREARR